MRKLKLLMMVCALMGAGQAWAADAYATYLTTEKGWAKVTDLSSMTLSDYYFAIVSNDNTDLMVKLDAGVENTGNHALWYKDAADPIKDNTYLWIIENNTTESYAGYTFRNVDYSKRVLQTNDGESHFCRTNWEQEPVRWSSYACALSNGAYTIQTLANGGSNYLGLWTYSHGYKDGEELAGNKGNGVDSDASEIAKFLFYAIPRTTAAALAIAAEGATKSSPYELGYFMFGRTSSDYTGATGIYEPGGWGSDTSNKIPEKYNDDAAPSTGDKVTKTITNAPNGYHKITVTANAAWISGRNEAGKGDAPETHDNSTVVTINGVSQNVPVRTDGSYNPVTLTFHTYVKDNNLSFKITNNDAAAFWFVWEVKDLFYGEAGEFTNGGTLEANQWYYYDAVGGNFTATASSDLSKISYIAQSGSSTPAALTSPTSLSATRYYFMSSVNQTLTLTNTDSAPFANGDYYLKVYNQDLYLSRAGNWGAEAATDIYGVAFTATRQIDGKYTLKSVDVTAAYSSDRGMNYGGASGGSWTDSESLTNWIFKASTNGYYIMPNSSYYTNTATYSALARPYNYLTATTTEGEAIEWQLINASTYASNQTDRLNTQAAAVATAAGLSSTTVSGLESDISSWIQSDYSSSINNPTLTTNTTGWTTLTYAYWGNSTASCADGACEIYDRVGGLKQTVSGLPEGLYKVTVDACYRLGSKDNSEAAGNKIDVTAFFSANTASQTNVKQIKSWYDYDGSRPTNRSSFAGVSSNYTNTLYVYVGEDEDLTLTIGTFGGVLYTWTPLMNWTLTRYEANATAAEKKALADAIKEAEAKTLGFKKDEYAPYNNIAAINALAAANAVDPETATGENVVAATTTLTGASWTANAAEVNAVYDGTFAAATNDGAPAGWTLTGGTGTGNSSNVIGGTYRPRAFVLTSGDNYAKLASFGQGDGTRSAFYIRYDDRTAQNAVFTYGATEGYTMPLKTNTIYKLTAQAGGWGHAKDIQFAIVNSSDENVVAQVATLENIDASGKVSDYEMYFVVPTTDNYKLKITNATSGQDNAAAVSNIVLKSTDALKFADNSEVPTYAPGTYPQVKITRTLTANRWATAIYPFAVSGVDNIAVLDSYNGTTKTIKFASAAASTANEPFLMRSTAGVTDITLDDVEVFAATASPVTKGDVTLNGAYTRTQVPVSDEENTYYVLSNNQICYTVSGDGKEAYINPYRAYIKIAEPAPTESRTLSFVLDDETTDISSALNEKTEMIKGNVYNLNGQLVRKNANGLQGLKKGIYIINGQRIIVK